MPTTGAVASSDPRSFGSHYAHDTETARPGYYAVDLTKYGVRAELSATTRTGWHRYSFPPTARANVLFDVGRANMPVRSSSIQVIGDRTLEGSVQAGGFCGSSDRHRVFFSARFDRPFAHTGTWRGGRLAPGGRQSAAGAGPNGAWVRFDTTAGRSVGLQVGISYASLGGARRNLAAEADGKSFDEVAGQASGRWASMLDRAKVAGGSPDGRVAFTTALYHAFLHPNVIGDVDGAYPAMDGKVRVATDHTPMGNLSLSGHLPHPEPAARAARARGVPRRGALDPGRHARRQLAAAMVARRVGDERHDGRLRHAVPGRELVRRAARRPRAGGVPRAARQRAAPATGSLAGERARRHPLLRAARLHPGGNGLPAQGLRQRLPATGLGDARVRRRRRVARADGARARPRRRRPALRPPQPQLPHTVEPAGAPVPAARPRRALAPERRPGVPRGQPAAVPLARPAGPRRTRPPAGRTARGEPRADRFFAYPALLRAPEAVARRRWVEHPLDFYGAETYNPNNEPDLHAPYLYAWTGQPWKTATVVRAAETLFRNGPEGMTGNDDLGTVSAWYVLSALGLIPP